MIYMDYVHIYHKYKTKYLKEKSKVIFTISHSTRTLKEFIDILITNKIKCLVDVRSYP